MDRRPEYKVFVVTLGPGEELIAAKHGVLSFILLQTTAGRTLQLAEFIDGKQGTFYDVPFGLNINFTSLRGVVVRNGSATQSGTFRFAVADAPLSGVSAITQDGINPSVNLSTFQTTGVVVDSVTGVINANIFDGAVGTWFDASAFVGKYVSVFITTSAGLVGGNLSFEQSSDAVLDPNGGAWSLQDATSTSDNQGASLTTAASTNYRRAGVVLSPLIRIRTSSAITAGTVQMKFIFSNTPYSNTMLPVRANGSSAVPVAGNVSHSTASTALPVLTGGRVFNTLDTTLASGDAALHLMDTSGRLVVNTVAPPELKWVYRTAGTPFTATADTAAAAAAGASIRRRPRRVRARNTSATAGALILKDGATEIDRIWLPASMTEQREYEVDCRTSANAALNIACSVAAMSLDISIDGINEF